MRPRHALLLGGLFPLALGFCAVRLDASSIHGAGSTAIYPILSKWAEMYGKSRGFSLDYEAVGSVKGLDLLKANAVHFAASDMPLKPADAKTAHLAQFPAVIIGIVPVYHLDLSTSAALTLDGPVLADIFQGRISRWNDPAIAALNLGLVLPETPIRIAARADGSGTTYNLTDYFCKISPAWRLAFGESGRIAWPVGVPCTGSAGIADYVAATPGALGYLEYSYALERHLAVCDMVSHDRATVRACPSSFQSAAEGTNYGDNLLLQLSGERRSGEWTANGETLTNQPGPRSWPITAASWLVFREDARRGTKAPLLDFAAWFLKDTAARDLANQMGYVPLDQMSVDAIQDGCLAKVK